MAPQSRAMIAPRTVGKNAMKASKKFSGLASDSRAVGPGYLFAALSGSRADGADFVDDAIARGAVAVIGRRNCARAWRPLGARFIVTDNPRLTLAREAAAFFAAQPKVVAAVTGTNGKTSVAVFLRQIWSALGKNAASLGTIGAVTPNGEIALKQTTPDPIGTASPARADERPKASIAWRWKHPATDWINIASTASTLAAAAFTNITRDHLELPTPISRHTSP